MKKLYPFLRISLVMIVSLLLTGCWSSKEIEDLGLIVGTSLDLATEEATTEEQKRLNMLIERYSPLRIKWSLLRQLLQE